MTIMDKSWDGSWADANPKEVAEYIAAHFPEDQAILIGEMQGDLKMAEESEEQLVDEVDRLRQELSSLKGIGG